MTKKINLDSVYSMLKSNIFIIFVFAIASVVSGLYFLKSNVVYNAWDLSFNLSRVLEIHQSIINGNMLPKIMLNNFSQNGSAVMTMYPDINLLFMVFGLFIFKSFTHFIYIMFMLRNFFALIIAYFSCYSFSRNKLISFLFSTSYTLSALSLWYNFLTTDYGVSTSFIFLPLIVFGTLLLLEKNYWKELTVGMSLVGLAHVITAVLSVILVGSLILINYRSINKAVIKSLGKALVITLLITSIFSIPFMILASSNSIAMPSITWLLNGVDFDTLIRSILSNTVYNPFIGIASFIGMILSIINYKNLPKYSKQLFWISVVLIIVASQFFPWNMLNNTFIRTTFQRPYRLYVIAQMLLSYLFAENAITLCRNKKQSIVVTLFITLLVLVTQGSCQKSIVDTAKLNSGNERSNSYNIKTLINEKPSYTDYFPKKALFLQSDITNHFGIEGNDKRITVDLLGNGKFAFKLDKTTKKIKIPFVMYNSIDYQVKLDSKNAKFYPDNHFQLTLGRVNKGKHIVQVIVHKSWYDYLSYVLSTFGIIILAFAWVKTLLSKRKK